MAELERGYYAETGQVDKATWHRIIERFDDANLYQTWSYDAVRRGQENIRHLILRRQNIIVAVAQARIAKIPFFGPGIAYVRWGPLWYLKDGDKNTAVFRQAVRALRNEYVERQGLLLRIFPILYEGEDQDLDDILYQEGYKKTKQENRHHTLLLDLRPSLDDIRKNFRQKWRNQLNQAETKKLEIIEGDSNQLFDVFIGLYQELIERKKFVRPNDIFEYKSIQNDLPDEYKMRIFLERSQNGFGSGAICSALGNKGVYLFGATNASGMSTKGSYLIQWRIIQWLKHNRSVWYDLNGINPEKNPGTYRFKAGIAGKHAQDVFFLGPFESYCSLKGRLISNFGNYYLNHFRKSQILRSIKARWL
jgi:peptidoglycan pentaglycine glycine transferase (the first glycine)